MKSLFTLALLASCAFDALAQTTFWTNDVSNCADWTFGNGSGEAEAPWTDIDINFECATEGPSGPYNQWAGGTGDGSAATGINSTSSDNGFLMIDSDLFGADFNYTPSWIENSWVQTADAIDCADYPYVSISFQTRYRCWDNGASDGSEKCFIEVSRDGTSWPDLTSAYTTNWANEGMVDYNGEMVQCRYEVFPESETGYQTENPSFLDFDITEAAGGQETVWIRFRWVGTWGYSWEIDDIEVYETPQNDTRIDNYVSFTNYVQTGIYEYGAWALSQLPETMFAAAKVHNVGYADQSNVMMTVDVNGETVMSNVIETLGYSASDTLVASYAVTEVGTVSLEYTLSQDEEDEDPGNNTASQSFEVTDLQWGRDNGEISAAFPGDGTVDYIAMPLYQVVNDVTIYGVDVAIMEGTEPNIPVRGLLMDINDPLALDEQYGGELISSPELDLVAGNFNATDAQDGLIWYTFVFDEPYEATAGELLGAAFEHFGGENVQIGEAQYAYDQTAFVYGPFGAGQAYDWYYTNEVPMVRLNLDENAQSQTVFGCTDILACNYNPEAVESDGSCYFPDDPCDDGDASTLNDAYNDACECEGETAIVGCINSNACNYNPEAVESDGSCYFPGDPCDDGDASTLNDAYNDACECEGETAIVGCINPNACNYNPEAVESDGSCYFPDDPCDDGDASTLNDAYNDACECEGETAIVGCINSNACNYNPEAVESDGSCYFPGDPCDDGDASTLNDAYNDACECEGETAIAGCINSNACNYNPEAVESDGSCYFPGDPCDDGDASTLNDAYNDACECEGETAIVGCINPNACNYNPEAVESDGSCYFPGDPCDDGDASTLNDAYNDACECEGESAIVGCINPNACNYNPEAVESDGSCYFPGDPCDDGDAGTLNDAYNDACECEGETAIVGCINPNACNYNPEAVESDGSCYFPGDPCDDGDASTVNDMYNDSCECEGEVESSVNDTQIEVALYPNPVRDWLSIRLEDGLAASLILFDPMGRVVQTWNTFGSTRLGLSHLPPGQYVMCIRPLLGPARSERISVLTWD